VDVLGQAEPETHLR